MITEKSRVILLLGAWLLTLSGCVSPGLFFSEYPTESLKNRVLLSSFSDSRASGNAEMQAYKSLDIQDAERLRKFSPDLIPLRLNLDTAVTVAWIYNPSLKEVRAEYEMAIADRKMAFSLFLPQASISYAVDGDIRQPAFVLDNPMFPTGPASDKRFQRLEMDIKMTLWDFGRTWGRYNQASLAEEIANLALAQKKQEIRFLVVEAYFSLLHAKKQRMVVVQALEQAKAHRKLAQNFENQGIVDHNDVLKADLEVAELEQQLIRADHAVERAKCNLNGNLGLSIHRETDVEEYPYDENSYNGENLSKNENEAKTKDKKQNESEVKFKNENGNEGRNGQDKNKDGSLENGDKRAGELAEYLRQAVKYRPEFEMVKKGIVLAEAEYGVSWAGHFPIVYVGGKYQWSDNQFQKYLGNTQIHSDNWSAEIGIQMDIFSGGRVAAEVKKSEAKIDLMVAKAKKVCDLIAWEVKDSFLALHEAQETMKIARRAIVQAEENLRLLNNKYNAQIVTSTDVVDGETLLTRAKQSYYSAFYNLCIARARLQKSTGYLSD